MAYKTTDWQNCYDLNWKGVIVDAAFAHPAKFAHGLIKRIYAHALATGLIEPGGVVVDPFGGVALGGLYAMQNGLHWIGCELEQKFVELGGQNITLWNERYSAHLPRWGSARLLQGDSRRLAEVVAGAGLVVSSPPYATGDSASAQSIIRRSDKSAEWIKKNCGSATNQGYGSSEGQLSEMKPGSLSAVIASPPFAGNTGGRGEASRNGIDSALFDRHSGGMKGGTGSAPANLDHLKMGDIGAVMKSPPYADGCVHTGGNDSKPEKIRGSKRGAYGVAVITSPPFAESIGSDDPAKRGGLFRDPKRAGDVNLTGSYGDTPGQLGAMKAGPSTGSGCSAVVGSPPFENSLDRGVVDPASRRELARANGISNAEHVSPIDMEKIGKRTQEYGAAAGQLGNDSGETFWQAARQIVEQCAAILPDQGAAIWVVKDYIKAGQRVKFSEQWRLLCEACGFETVEVVRAWLVKDRGEQVTMAAGHDTSASTTNLLGETVATEGAALANKRNRTERKSFFRRLHEKKRPDLAIDYEVVLFMRKVAG